MVNPVIETLIGLVFVYLLFSMVCSTIQEFIAALFSLRAKMLREGLANILCGDKNLVEEIYAHPLVKGLSRRTWWDRLLRREAKPSYISAEVFAKAFVAAAGVDPDEPAKVPKAASNQEPLAPNTRQLLETLARYSPGDINTLRQSVEGWYNDAMDRVSGWYKRQVQVIILIIAVVVSVSSNADTFMLSSAFWHDPTLRAAAVTAANDWVKNHAQQQPVQDRGDKLAELYPSKTEPGAAAVPVREETLKQAGDNLVNTLGQVQAQLGTINVPLGWFCTPCEGGTDKGAEASAPTHDMPSGNSNEHVSEKAKKPTPSGRSTKCVRGQMPADGSAWLIKIFGLSITALAISQGAPFWFDLLQKLVNVRLAGDAPDEKKKTK